MSKESKGLEASRREMRMVKYDFTKFWFNEVKHNFVSLMDQFDPSRILEIGSFEGLSSVFFIDYTKNKRGLELHCVDTWEGSIEHQSSGHETSDMNEIENRFRQNIELAVSDAVYPVDVRIHKVASDLALASMLSKGMKNYFDLIYVDGSHQASDVISDAVLSFRLLRVGGALIFDDYLWAEPLPYGVDPIRCPKISIDAFTNIYCRKIRILEAPLKQLYIQKIAD